MTTLTRLAEKQLAHVEEKLAFKEAALRYCNHSKKRDKLYKEVQELREIAEAYRGLLEGDNE